jgi:hypothetical protein
LKLPPLYKTKYIDMDSSFGGQNYVIKMKQRYNLDINTSAILKHLTNKAIKFLTFLYNALLRTTQYPILWKVSTVRMIPKDS